MRIRRASPDEAPLLTGIAHAAKASWGYPAAWLAAWRDELTLTADYVATHRVLVAEGDDGGAAGTCAVEEQGDRWEIAHLWVRPEAQGRGVGAALVRQALAEARARGASRVRVVADPHAAPFYRRLGARDVGSLPAGMEGAPERRVPLLVFELPGAAGATPAPR